MRGSLAPIPDVLHITTRILVLVSASRHCCVEPGKGGWGGEVAERESHDLVPSDLGVLPSSVPLLSSFCRYLWSGQQPDCFIRGTGELSHTGESPQPSSGVCISSLSLRSWLVLEFWLLTWLSFGRILSSKSSSRTCLLQKEEAETWLVAQDGRQMHARMHESLETRIRKWIDGLMEILIDRQVMWACERGWIHASGKKKHPGKHHAAPETRQDKTNKTKQSVFPPDLFSRLAF